MNIDSFKDEFLNSNELADFKLPTPQPLSQNPFVQLVDETNNNSNSNSSQRTTITSASNTRINNQQQNLFQPIPYQQQQQLITPNTMTLPTPTSLLSNPFSSQTANSNNNNGSNNQQQQNQLFSTVQNQVFDVTSKSNLTEEDVNNFFEGLDSSTFTMNSPWGTGGFSVPTPNKLSQHPFQQHQQQHPSHQQQQQQHYPQQQQHPQHIPHPQQHLMQQHVPYGQFSPSHYSNSTSSPSPTSSYAGSPQQPVQQFVPSPSSCYPSASTNSFTNTSLPNFSGSTSTPPVNLIKLVEGFNRPLREKQIGGKDNTKHTIPTQVVELAVNKLPPNSDPTVLSVRASVLGYDRVSRTKVILGHLSDKPFEEKGSGPMARWISVFDDIIVQFSSHNNGQKLALRFQLLDADKKPVCHVDSYEFETITKRGLEKIKERAKRKRNDNGYDALVDCVDPPMGLTTGGQLVKVIGRGFVCPPVSNVCVKFGEREAREIHSVKRNYIVCETPEGEPGKVDVAVSLDKKAYLPSSATFEYVDQNDTDRVQEMIRNMFNPLHRTSEHQEGSSGNSNKRARSDNGSPSPTNLSSWVAGKETDLCGFNMLHHACARGYLEMSYFLLENDFCDMNAVDNYGRTALFWAMWSKNTNLVAYLISKGADMTISDEVNDTFLHMASSPNEDAPQDNIQHVKHVLFWMLKFDDTSRTQARFLQNVLQQKNDDGLTASEAAKAKGNETLFNLFKAVEQLSAMRIEDNIISLRNIKFRSGSNNGKFIKDILNDNVMTITLDLTREHYIITAKTSNNKQIRSVIANTNIAFIILDKKEYVAQFTLLKSPIVEQLEDDNEWRECPEDGVMNVLSFNLELTDGNKLQQINDYIVQGGHLYEFQEMCFCYRASSQEQGSSNDKLKVDSLPSNKLDSTASVDKMHILRMRMNSIHLNKTPLSATTSTTTTNADELVKSAHQQQNVE